MFPVTDKRPYELERASINRDVREGGRCMSIYIANPNVTGTMLATEKRAYKQFT
jgi:hypothetical protein